MSKAFVGLLPDNARPPHECSRQTLGNSFFWFPPKHEVASIVDVKRHAKLAEMRLRSLLAVAGLLVVAGSGVVVEPHAAFAARSPGVEARSSGPSIAPKEPEALATGLDGRLYIVDTGRDEVLQRLPDGEFVVVAGDGRHGFSGDGGPAVDARLALDPDSGIAVSADGTLYIADSGNDRVRAVLPSRTIETVAGGGQLALSKTRPVPARDTSLNEPNGSVAGLAMGPEDVLYFAINSGVYRLAPNGDIYWVVGEHKPLPKNYSWDGNPAVQNDFLYADRVAFDGKGDLYVAGGGGLYGLYEKTASGVLRFITVLRDGGTVGVLASGPNGSVIESAGEGVVSLAPDGTTTTVATPGELQRLLGKDSGFAGGGVTTGSGGDVYVDIDASIWAGPTSALLEIHPNGTMTTLWKLRELP
jgi:hypothetical protein